VPHEIQKSKAAAANQRELKTARSRIEDCGANGGKLKWNLLERQTIVNQTAYKTEMEETDEI
jgi:hypothetical protein